MFLKLKVNKNYLIYLFIFPQRFFYKILWRIATILNTLGAAGNNLIFKPLTSIHMILASDVDIMREGVEISRALMRALSSAAMTLINIHFSLCIEVNFVWNESRLFPN